MKNSVFLCCFIAVSTIGIGAPLSIGAQNSLRSQMLGHVEKILVVDSIAVDKDDFLSAYRITPSAGSLLDADAVLEQLKRIEFPETFVGDPVTGFTNEFNDYLIWSQRDTSGYYRLAESVKLVDGTWSSPRFTSAVLNEGSEVDEDDDEFAVTANAMYPFMADDGQTLYYAADNTLSMGGLDIFIATKDPSDDSFLIPGNMGLPFNSEYDDYMMVIDRESGLGWWATDRNQLEDLLTIYIFVPSDVRINVDKEDPNLEAYATLEGWESLMDEESLGKIEELKKTLANIKPVDKRIPDFSLPMPGGKTYRFFSDFKSKKAANDMMLYLEEKSAFEKKQMQLEALRKEFHSGNRQTADKIRTLEEELRKMENNLKKLLSKIYQTESEV